MYFCYVDESGHCGRKFNAEQPVEVLVGVLSDATKIHKTNRDHSTFLKGLLENHSISVAEIKSSQIFRGRKEWSGVSADVRKQVFRDLLSWVNNRSCKLIVCPIDSGKFFDLKKNKDQCAEMFEFPYIAGAMNVLLSLQRLKYGTKNNKGKTVVIFDEQGDMDAKIVSLLRSDSDITDKYTQIKIPRKKDAKVERFCQIIDIPFFSKSEHSQLIQIADLVAFVVRRYIELKSIGMAPSFGDELEIISEFYIGIKASTVPAVHINPTTKGDALIQFYSNIRPEKWTPKKWEID